MSMKKNFLDFFILNKQTITETVRFCNRAEVPQGTCFVEAIISTTKRTVDELMELGYGNIDNLAICRYRLHKGSIIFNMENVDKNKAQYEEPKVLILTANKLVSHCNGEDSLYIGADGKPALMYTIDVYPPETVDNKKSK